MFKLAALLCFALSFFGPLLLAALDLAIALDFYFILKLIFLFSLFCFHFPFLSLFLPLRFLLFVFCCCRCCCCSSSGFSALCLSCVGQHGTKVRHAVEPPLGVHHHAGVDLPTYLLDIPTPDVPLTPQAGRMGTYLQCMLSGTSFLGSALLIICFHSFYPTEG